LITHIFLIEKSKKGTAKPWTIATDYNSVKATPTLQKTHKELSNSCFCNHKK
jgi:hypothetical protein